MHGLPYLTNWWCRGVHHIVAWVDAARTGKGKGKGKGKAKAKAKAKAKGKGKGNSNRR